ncbi:MAG: hypothetical protein ACRD96_22680 [Bryobacteraceae bacterium]
MRRLRRMRRRRATFAPWE